LAVNGENAWLHVMVGTRATLYEIDEGRGFEVSAAMLGTNFQGHLIHDGWKSYDKFRKATHQQCVAHILRRSRELRDMASGAGVLLPQAIILLFQDALAARLNPSYVSVRTCWKTHYRRWSTRRTPSPIKPDSRSTCETTSASGSHCCDTRTSTRRTSAPNKPSGQPW
jgi:hypothetical protein